MTLNYTHSVVKLSVSTGQRRCILMARETTVFQVKLQEMGWKVLLLYSCLIYIHIEQSNSNLNFQLSYQTDKDNTCFIRKPTKTENLWDFQIHLKTLSFLPGSGTACLTHIFLSSSWKRKKEKLLCLERISVEVLQWRE